MRHNKKKRGPYREAIKQATCEAHKTIVDFEKPSNLTDNPISLSPREVDVVSWVGYTIHTSYILKLIFYPSSIMLKCATVGKIIFVYIEKKFI